MKLALLSLAILATGLATAASVHVPEQNIRAICKAQSAAARMAQLTPEESMDDCVRSEGAAKQQLGTLWASTPARIRKQCKEGARALGMRGYVDLLACVQIALDNKSAAAQKEAAKK